MKTTKPLIGLATGAYDVLHIGHINFLKAAKAKCDVLVVGINTDAIISRYKGENRPINTQEARKAMLEALKYVDKVFIFNTWEVELVIAKYKPNIYFITKGDPGEEVKTNMAKKYGAKLAKLPSYNDLPLLKSPLAEPKKLQKSCPFYYLYFKNTQKPKYALAKISSTDIINKLESLTN